MMMSIKSTAMTGITYQKNKIIPKQSTQGANAKKPP